jgi:DNA-binding response OmpR family regulator
MEERQSVEATTSLGEAYSMESPPPERPLFVDTTPIEIGPLRLDPVGFVASVDGQDIALTLGEFSILLEFARNPYQVLRRERLIALLRANPGNGDGLNASPRAVDTHIARLRAKLRRAGYDCIKTMRFVGYRFIPLPEQNQSPAS